MWIPYVLIVTLIFLYHFSKRKFNYWKQKNVPYLKPLPIVGNYGEFIFLKTFVGDVSSKICDKFPNEPYIGAFYGTEPALIVQDPELIKLILTKDFYYFNGREVSSHYYKEPLTNNVFFSYGDHWKVQRQNLSPLFSTAKIKTMFHLIKECSHELENLLENERNSSGNFEVCRLVMRFAMECIGSCSFGVETKVMQKDYESNPYTIVGDQVFARSAYIGTKNTIRSIWPTFFYGLGFKMYSDIIKDFYVGVLTEVFKQRDFKPSNRKDFVDLVLNSLQKENLMGDSLTNLKNSEAKSRVSVKVDINLLAAQCLSFLGAGYETTATVLAMTLFEVAKREDIQEKVFKEVDEHLEKHNNELTYDIVSQLPYLDACLDEAMRLHPLLTNLTREAMEDYIFPDGLQVDKGVRIFIPVYKIHRNPIYFTDPETFRPERFLPEERQNIKPYTYLPFGEGQRVCIGMRFAKMLMLACLVTIFKSYKLQLAEGMTETIEFDPRVLIHCPRSKINLKFIRRENGNKQEEICM